MSENNGSTPTVTIEISTKDLKPKKQLTKKEHIKQMIEWYEKERKNTIKHIKLSNRHYHR